jgi:sulfite reductase (NADPH) flavoprotein alpha-component
MPAAATLPRLPLPKDRAQLLSSLIDGLDAVSLWWLSGYTAGLASKGSLPATAAPEARAAVEPRAGARLTVVYGSQTGNCKRVAESLAHAAEREGLAVRLVRADAYAVRELAQERLLVVVISTQGDGDPPDDARGFLEFLAGRKAPKLPELTYAVLGLGDSSYPQFCITGRNLDARLAELGGKRLLDFGEADLDYETVVESWSAQALATARERLRAEAPASVDNVTPLRPRAEAVTWSPANPFHADVVAHQRITGDASAKDVRHLELDLTGAGLDYEPGDALGVVAQNPAPLVAEILDALHLDAAAAVTVKDTTRPLGEWLGAHREITRLSRPFIAALAERSADAALQRLLQPEAADDLRRLMDTAQPVDLLARHPAEWTGAALVAALRPLAPRLYSIASSRAAVGDEVHLTVAHVEYHDAAGKLRWGAASHWLATHAEGDELLVYLERNERFRLPADADRDVIMVGPGTGVAPFRAFVQERTAAGAGGRNWLFFGNPHFRDDFLYQLEWQAALKAGSLAQLDLAFSRDQADKIYVQQRLRERGRQVFDWLEGGAHFYVCGATGMARDVEAALRDIVIAHGGRTPEAADEYLAALRDQHRYARDVY